MTARLRLVLVAALFSASATGLGAAFWWPVYRDEQFVICGVVAGVLGVVLAAVSVLGRWAAWVLALATVALFLLIGVPLAVPSMAIGGVLPSLGGLAALVAGVALGWKQLLTITIPVGDYQALLVPVLVLVLASAVLGVRLGVRESGFTWALLGPVLLAVTGILFGAEPPPQAVPLTVGLLACCLGWVVAARALRRPIALRAAGGAGRGVETARTLAAGGLILALAAVVSVGATAAVPLVSERQLLRDQLEQAFDPRQEPSPLAAFRSYLQPERDSAVQLLVSGLAAEDRIQIAVLDHYDGVVYGVGGAVDGDSGTFVPIPTAIDRSAVAGTPRRIEVTTVEYSGVWLPLVGRVERVSFGDPRRGDDYVVSLATGTAALVGGVRPGETYRAESVGVRVTSPGELAGLTPGDAAVPPVEVVPEGVPALLDSWVGGTAQPGDRIAQALERLSETGYISHGLSEEEAPSRSGHGADRITELVTGSRMIGDAEQYAVTAALMARQLGFPARVVMGFAPPQAGESGVVEVVGRDVTAWIEVATAERGWVAVDPVPELRPIPDQDPDELSRISRPQSVVPPPADDTPDVAQQSPPQTARDEPDDTDPVLAAFLVVARTVVLVLLAALILGAPFLLVIAAKLQRRRRRRRARDPVDRIQGGWDDFADAAVDHGIDATPSATRSEFAARVGVLSGRVLAAAVDRASFAPERVDDDEAYRVWEAVDELRAGLRARETFWARVRATISVRSFRTRYRGSSALGGRGKS